MTGARGWNGLAAIDGLFLLPCLLGAFGCAGLGDVQWATFVPTSQGDVVFAVHTEPGSSPFGPTQQEAACTYSTHTGERLGEINLGKATTLHCDPATPGRVWCAGEQGDIWLFQAEPLLAIATTSSIAKANPTMKRIERASWLDLTTRALIVEDADGFRWSLDPKSAAATRLPANTSPPRMESPTSGTLRLADRPDGCSTWRSLEIGTARYELEGSPRTQLFKDKVPVAPGESFYEGRFVVDACDAITFTDGSMLVTDDRGSGEGGAFVRVAGDGKIVWRSGPFYNPYGLIAAKRTGDQIVVVLRTELASMSADTGNIKWRFKIGQ